MLLTYSLLNMAQAQTCSLSFVSSRYMLLVLARSSTRQVDDLATFVAPISIREISAYPSKFVLIL